MQLAFACPLAMDSLFCLGGPSTQHNSNASTNLRALNECEELPSIEADRCSAYLDSSNRTSFKVSDNSCAGRHVDCPTAIASRSRSMQGHSSALQKNRQQQRKHPSQASSYLVPLALASNQSNMFHRFLGITFNSNVQNTNQPPQPAQNALQQQQPANSNINVPDKDESEQRELLPNSGVRYWNVYEYQDIRPLDISNSHVFDPQVDSNWHRETIIQDCYNRLRASCSNFRPPTPYHFR